MGSDICRMRRFRGRRDYICLGILGKFKLDLILDRVWNIEYIWGVIGDKVGK